MSLRSDPAWVCSLHLICLCSFSAQLGAQVGLAAKVFLLITRDPSRHFRLQLSVYLYLFFLGPAIAPHRTELGEICVRRFIGEVGLRFFKAHKFVTQLSEDLQKLVDCVRIQTIGV